MTTKREDPWMRYLTIVLVAVLVMPVAGGSGVGAAGDAPADGKSAPEGEHWNGRRGKRDDSGPRGRNAATENSGVRFDPVIRQIQGWTVHVEPTLIDGAHQEVGARALAMLGDHLRRISVLVTGERLKELKRLEIWIEYHHPELGSMQYHPSVEWLKAHGHDPRLWKKVHITRAESLLSRQQMLQHPWVVLHELAHAYHDQYLGFDDLRVKEAYQAAEKEGLYEEVLLYTGHRGRHYGLTDHKEYFAEGTEAYFGRNDFYPFVRAELKHYDRRLHDLLREIWGRAP